MEQSAKLNNIVSLIQEFNKAYITEQKPKVEEDLVTVAILAKDKAHCLPLYLKCIEEQTFPKNRTLLYIRTNNNTDETQKMLEDWIGRVKDQYKEVYFDPSNVEVKVEEYKPHEWNETRFEVLAKIRQDSVNWAKEKGTHYFVVDCDNFIQEYTLQTLVETKLPVVGPFMATGDSFYSNYHHRTTPNGYFFNNNEYYYIYHQYITGLIEVDVVHCSYFIRNDILPYISYFPQEYVIGAYGNRHEYVIFSENLRRSGISQYLDNRYLYGRITFADAREDLMKEPWMLEYEDEGS